ncbi:peptidoglycan-recognition protein SC2-like [Diprion similis]|uniref:peptidoglycan-recognition protein SC2-like n=1 Tax=Diprion similis TaxID=362088 RepID=UPI001EF96E1A|nr:peptidoglycan-recognition protein SC2-like [Diprion similis]
MNSAALTISAILLIVESFVYTNADCPTIIKRSQWGAREANGNVSPLRITPAPFVVIHHTASTACSNQAVCQAKVRNFQIDHIDRRSWSDIGYNFLVGEDGNIYEGRGWDKRGAHTVPFNSRSIGISFIGNFMNREPAAAAVNAAKRLIQCGVELGKIKNTYGLLGHKQAAQTACPGDKLFDMIKTWPGWQSNPSR